MEGGYVNLYNLLLLLANYGILLGNKNLFQSKLRKFRVFKIVNPCLKRSSREEVGFFYYICY